MGPFVRGTYIESCAYKICLLVFSCSSNTRFEHVRCDFFLL